MVLKEQNYLLLRVNLLVVPRNKQEIVQHKPLCRYAVRY